MSEDQEARELNTAWRQAFQRSARELFPSANFHSVESFNDAADRTGEDVQLVSKHAIHSMSDLLELEDPAE